VLRKSKIDTGSYYLHKDKAELAALSVATDYRLECEVEQISGNNTIQII
jgi:hypothetical protein